MIKVAKYDAAELLKTKEHCIEYLNAAADEEDISSSLFFSIMDDIARSEGARPSLRSAGLTADELCASLKGDINERLNAVANILRALGVRICFVPAELAQAEHRSPQYAELAAS